MEVSADLDHSSAFSVLGSGKPLDPMKSSNLPYFLRATYLENYLGGRLFLFSEISLYTLAQSSLPQSDNIHIILESKVGET